MNTPQAVLTNLDTPRSGKLIDHLRADWIELICLANTDREISKSQIISRLDQSRDVEESEGMDEHQDLSVSEVDDRISLQVGDWYRYLEFREGVFGDFYPFSVTDDGDTLVATEEITDKQKLYIFLLLSSNLANLSPGVRDPLTNGFEIVSKEALKGMLPASAQVHLFHPRHHEYAGNFWARLNILAGEIHETVKAKEHEFSKYAAGEMGLDVVAWIPLGDDLPSLLILFGQCACTLEWVSKQKDSSFDAWDGKLTFTASLINMAFIPFCFRRPNGDWYNKTDIHRTILIDRLRLVNLLRERYSIIQSLPLYAVVDQVIEFEESDY